MSIQYPSNRRRLLAGAGSALLSTCIPAFAQQPTKLPRVGVFFLGPGTNVSNAFFLGLRQLGYVDGKNIVLEIRSPDDVEGLAKAASEFVRLNVDVILAGGRPANLAARKATSTIPIVMPLMADPVAEGMAQSLARPGGNITGLTFAAAELNAKRVQLLKEAFPRISRLAVLYDSNAASSMSDLDVIRTAAKHFGLEVATHDATNASALERAFKTARSEHAGAILTVPSPFFGQMTARLAQLALASRLPAMYHYRDYVDAGGLMGYGPSFADMYQRAATYVDKILKGAKPGDLPIEQPSKLELVLNRKAAAALGIKFPESLLLRADEIVQ